MVYINSSTLVIDNSLRHCLELFDVTTAEMTTYAGVCGTSGSQLTGHRIDDIRLTSVISVAFDGSHMIYSSSSGQYKIIGINMTSDMVHEVCGTGGMHGKSLLFDQSSQSLFVLVNHAIGKADISTGQFTVLSGSGSTGDSVGDLRTTEYSFPFNMMQVNASTLLVSDRNNDR